MKEVFFALICGITVSTCLGDDFQAERMKNWHQWRGPLADGVAPHGDPHMAVHLIASIPNALIMETYPKVKSQYNPALPLFPVKDGYIELPDLPGLGIDPDPADIRKYAKK